MAERGSPLHERGGTGTGTPLHLRHSGEAGAGAGGTQRKKYTMQDFEIVKTIGTGTFARVLLCREHQSKEYLALKVLHMSEVVRLKQVEHVKNEKKILNELQHPFLVDLITSWKDPHFLYLLFPFIPGGELFSYLRSAGRFSPSTTQFYLVEIISALEYLHSLSVVYRDLKPENLLLDSEGHLRITDFGFAKRVSERTWTLCGTPEYLAPEVIQSKGHNKAVDWWALGILTYEMLAGYPPFFDENPFGIYEKILCGKVEWPRHVEPVCKDLVKRLLVQDRTKRLGNMKAGTEDVKRHRWFKSVDWESVYYKQLKPPIVPKVTYPGDHRNYDFYPEVDLRRAPAVSERERALFQDF